MAKIAFVEVNDANIIVGVHSDDIPAALLPVGYSTHEKLVEDPSSLVGLSFDDIDLEADKRDLQNQLTLAQSQRLELKQLSIELDLMVRLSEDTTDKQAEFDALMKLYQNPV